MARKVKEFVQVDAKSLDGLIEALVAVRDTLPKECEAELMLRGCDVFGRHIAVAYMRPQTAEEAECEARYADVYHEVLGRQEQERAAVASRTGFGRLRAVA